MLLVRDVANSKSNFMIALLVGLIAGGIRYGFVIGLFIGTFIFYMTEKKFTGLSNNKND